MRLAIDPALPIAARADEIRDAIRAHPVVIVAGETSSGKTTQLPKICLMAGREHIGHTQPRRIAARSVAERMAAELGEPLGQTVGYQVRFSSQRSASTRVKVMTDGILLAEIAHDRQLRRYDTIIVDEAHERSLNIDFLLGYLKQLLPQRPELRVVVTSATIDTARFSAHFSDAPVIEVSGRTYPVEVRYRPPRADGDADDRDVVDAIADGVRELVAHGPGGDILVFCSGEREIRDATEAIDALRLRSTTVLPLYARLSAAEQHAVFEPHTGRRIVVATNVAETSLTVPGIRSVIDPGFARISRYSTRTKVQRLPVEPISRASADQRAGRCGRLGPGVCLRLYSQEDFESRDEFTQPEILRTNLASVILQMADARLGDIERFPFVEAPDATQIRDGMRLLAELGAIQAPRQAGRASGVRLTPVGRELARLPVDPKLGRMLVEANRQGCLREVQAIVAGLAIPDVRERPADAQQQADAAHRRFWAPMPDADTPVPTPDGSDIMALWRLWAYLKKARRDLSGNAFRRLCRAEYLHYLRVREWQDLHNQLKQACDDLGFHRDAAPADAARIHTAVLSGLLSHVGLRDDAADAKRPDAKKRRGPREYRGTRGARFAINPGSSVAKTQPPLVMAVELVETSRLWARTVAAIQPEWVEEVGEHLLARTYSEPHWSQRGGQCVAAETVTLLGVPIVSGRSVSYGSIDPATARAVFIQSALVEGQWTTRHAFWARNQEVRAQAEQMEERARRHDMIVDDVVIAAFYDARLPEGIVSVAHFDRWWRERSKTAPRALDLSLDDLLEAPVDGQDADAFPSVWPVGEAFDVEYVFDPGSAHDGVTVDIPLARLGQADPAWFTWQVPGFREAAATALIKGLAKQWRALLVPAPDTARDALTWLAAHQVTPGSTGLADALGQAVKAVKGVDVPPGAWNPGGIDQHLRVRFRVRTASGEETGRDLDELRRRLEPRLSRTLNRAAPHVVHEGAATWAFGTIPATVEGAGLGYPALVDKVNVVGVQVFTTADAAQRSHRAGLRRLIALTTVDPATWVVSRLRNDAKFALATSPYASVPALLADARLKAIGDLMDACGGLGDIRDATAFAALADAVRAGAAARMRDVVNTAAKALAARATVTGLLPQAPKATRDDVAEQMGELVYAGFVAATPQPYFERLPVYLAAAARRLEQARDNPARDAARLADVAVVEDAYARACDACDGPLPDALSQVGWLIEEYRVSVFAQSLGTLVPVSAKRIRTALDAAIS